MAIIIIIIIIAIGHHYHGHHHHRLHQPSMWGPHSALSRSFGKPRRAQHTCTRPHPPCSHLPILRPNLGHHTLANPRSDETRAMNFERSLTLGMEEVLASRGMRPKPAPSPGIFPGEVFRVGAALPCLASSFVPSMHFLHPSGPEDDPSKKAKKSNIIRRNFRAWVS